VRVSLPITFAAKATGVKEEVKIIFQKYDSKNVGTDNQWKDIGETSFEKSNTTLTITTSVLQGGVLPGEQRLD